MRYRFVPLCALALLASLPGCFDSSPERYADLAELAAYQKKEGFIVIEHFGDAWPAKVVKERFYRDEVNVTLANSQAYRFDEFDGYKLKVMKLKGVHNAEIVVVLRSKEKEQ